jgi:hypothetical protein
LCYFLAADDPGPLEVQAVIEQLHQDAGHFAFWAFELTRMNVQGHDKHATAWVQIYQEIDDCLRALDPMLPSFQVDRGPIHQIYTTMRRLKPRWLTQRIGERRFVKTEPDGLDPEFRLALHEEEAQLTQIVEQLKRETAGGRGTLSDGAGFAMLKGDGAGNRGPQGLDHPSASPTRVPMREGTTEHNAERGGRRTQAGHGVWPMTRGGETCFPDGDVFIMDILAVSPRCDSVTLPTSIQLGNLVVS